MKNNLVVLLLLLSNSVSFAQNAAKKPTPYPGGVWEPGPAKYGYTIVDSVPVKMDDGIVLRASIAYPADLASKQKASGKFPVVVEHTPYVRLGNPINPITFFAEHGYITVVVRARGAGASEGEVQLFGHRDRQDGKTIVDWAARQLENSDGRVAFIGCSYPGGLALGGAATVETKSPLKAVVCACNGLESVKRQSWMVGGIPTTGFTNYTTFGKYLFGNSPATNRFFDNAVANVMSGGDMAYNSIFWKERLPMELAVAIVKNNVPVLLYTGWKDILDVPAFRNYVAFQNASINRSVHEPMIANQKTTPRYQIIMGNWEHAEGLDVGIYLQWLETWLKGVNTGIQNTQTPMHLFEGGSNRWINAAGYPLVSNYTTLYLNDPELLKANAPVRTGSGKLVWGDTLQSGKLSFSTPVLTKGITLAGPISATIYASSSNTNLELLAKLYDVAPDGSETIITNGVILGSQRKLDQKKSWKGKNGIITWPWQTLEVDEYLTPGQVYRFDISLDPIQWGIEPNHRLKFELTTQTSKDLCPSSGPPPKNGCDPCRLTKPQQETLPGGVYTIMQSPEWSSSVHLPQMPYRVFPSVRSGTTPTAWNEGMRIFIDKAFELPLDWGSNKKN